MKRITFLIVNSIFCLLIQAQIPGTPKNLLSPNAASLGQYGEIPVSLYTGTPNINIPLYEMTYGDITVPISLSYHASGIRPDQHPGWVGLGWTLQAGGVISRTVKGQADDYCTTYNGVLSDKYGYYFTYDILNRTDWSTTTRMMDIVQNSAYEYTDREPDEFSFNFLNYSGKFYLDEHRNWKIECDKPIKVEVGGFAEMPTFNNIPRVNQPKHFSNFTITDEYGNKYLFGNNDIEYSIDYFNQSTSNWNATSWYLNQITLVNGETVMFKYKREPFIDQLYSSYTADLGTYNTDHSLWVNSSTNSTSSPKFSYGGQLISPIYLTTILSGNDSIALEHSYSKELQFDSTKYCPYFDPFTIGSVPATPIYLQRSFNNSNQLPMNFPQSLTNLQWQQLDKIHFYSKNKSHIKSYDLLYSSDKNQRLTLNKIIESGNNTTEKGKIFNFDYYNINKLPPYLSHKVDHWGFYNGRLSIFHTADFDTAQYYLRREPSIYVDTISVGSLKRITYPTGGATEFIYSPHDYQLELSYNRWSNIIDTKTNNIAGGLRISKIINYTNNINDTINKTVKEYIYRKNYTIGGSNAVSSGVLGGRIKYYFDNYVVTAYNNSNVTYYKKIFSSQSVLPACENSAGSHIGYTEVVEKNSTAGFTRYIFSNFDNGYKDEQYVTTIHDNLSPYQPYNSKSIDRGKMVGKSIYDSNGNLKLKTRINYQRLNADTNFVKSVFVKNYVASAGTYIYYADGTAYKIYTYPFLPINQIDSIYESGSSTPLIKYTSYAYNPNKLLSKQISCDSKGDSLITQFKYSGDVGFDSSVTPSAQDTIFNSLKFMKDNNMLAYPVETTNSKKKAGVGEKEWINSAKLQLYKKMKPTNATVDFCKLSSELDLSIKSPVQNNTDFKNINLYLTASNNTCAYDSRYNEKMRYNNYDAHGNPQSVTKNGVENSVYLWSYNYRYPVVEIKNATWADVSKYMSESQVSDMAKKTEPDATDLTLLSSLKTNLNNSLISNYTFKPLVGITKATSPRGTATQYGYDALNRLSTLNDNNNKIISQYQYGYVKFDETTTTTTTSSTLYARVFNPGNLIQGCSNNVSVGVVGGSGSYSYHWVAKNSNGEVVSTNDTSTPTLLFVPATVGSFTIQCQVTDLTTSKSYTTEQSMNSVPLNVTLTAVVIDNHGILLYGASVTIKTSSNNIVYSWYLLDAQGTVLRSFENTTSKNIGFTYDQLNLTVRCVVKDVITGYTVTLEKNNITF
jgi:hypothetical protein